MKKIYLSNMTKLTLPKGLDRQLLVVAATFSGVEELQVIEISKEGLCSYLLSALHEGTWREEEGAKLLFDALLPVKEPATLWASEVFDNAQLKGIVADLNGMGCNITLAAEPYPHMCEYEASAWRECAEHAQLG